MAQRLNNADDKNGNEDDPRPKKELGRQISQRAWQMVRSSKKKKNKKKNPASHKYTKREIVLQLKILLHP